jgi:cysteine desulfurase/selenocysteine lyase
VTHTLDSRALDVAALRRNEFPWTERGDAIYLNSASTGPLPARTVAALDEWAHLRAEPHRISDARQFDTLAHGRQLVARLIGAEPGEIALAVNTSMGLNLAASALPLEKGDVVLTPDLEFPANVYPWMQLARQRGVEYRRLPLVDGRVDEEAIHRALETQQVKVVAVSWVSFATGYTVDLEALGRACRAHGAYLVVDAIQGIGARRLDLRTVNADIVACGGQKWLLSPWGTGFVWVRRQLIDRLEPNVVSWMAVRDSDDFSRLVDYDLTWRDDARRFEMITLPYQDFAAFNASLELLHELGPEAIERHVASLCDEIVRWAEERRDVKLVTPADRARRAGIVAVRPPDAAGVSARLKAAGVAHSLREGSVRLAPHCLIPVVLVGRALEVVEGG